MGPAADQTELALQLLRNTQLPGPDRVRQVYGAYALSQVQCTDPVLLEPLAQAYKPCTAPEIGQYLALVVARFGRAAKDLTAEVVARLDVELVRGIGPAAIELLLQDWERSDARRVFAIYTVLGQLGPAAEAGIPVLVKEVNAARDPWFEANAAQVLGQIGIFNEPVVASLEKASQSSVKDLAEAANTALAKRKK
jgi:hypothetical protein